MRKLLVIIGVILSLKLCLIKDNEEVQSTSKIHCTGNDYGTFNMMTEPKCIVP